MGIFVDNGQVIAVCEKCDSNIYGNEMYIMDKTGTIFCMDCANGLSQDMKKQKEIKNE